MRKTDIGDSASVRYNGTTLILEAGLNAIYLGPGAVHEMIGFLRETQPQLLGDKSMASMPLAELTQRIDAGQMWHCEADGSSCVFGCLADAVALTPAAAAMWKPVPKTDLDSASEPR